MDSEVGLDPPQPQVWLPHLMDAPLKASRVRSTLGVKDANPLIRADRGGDQQSETTAAKRVKGEGRGQEEGVRETETTSKGGRERE